MPRGSRLLHYPRLCFILALSGVWWFLFSGKFVWINCPVLHPKFQIQEEARKAEKLILVICSFPKWGPSTSPRSGTSEFMLPLSLSLHLTIVSLLLSGNSLVSLQLWLGFLARILARVSLILCALTLGWQLCLAGFKRLIDIGLCFQWLVWARILCDCPLVWTQ